VKRLSKTLRSPRKFLILLFLRNNPSTRGEVARECLQGSEDPKNLASTLLHRYEREGIVEKGGGKYSLTSKGEDRIEYMRGELGYTRERALEGVQRTIQKEGRPKEED